MKALVLALLLLPVSLGAEESALLALYAFFGVPAQLEVTPWRLQLADLHVFGFHAAALSTPPVAVHVAVDLLGPALVFVPLLALGLAAGRGPAGAALLGNAAVMAFFALLQGAFAVGEFVLHRDMDALLAPELNYGVSLLIVVLVCLGTVRGAPRRRPGYSSGEHRPSGSTQKPPSQ